MPMTPQQTSTLRHLREGQVAFPPLYESDKSSVVALLVMSFTGPSVEFFPPEIEIQTVRIFPDGSYQVLQDRTYFLGKNSD